jgi:hypothetical protein
MMATQSHAIPGARKYRWYQYSLRAILVTVAVVAAGCGLVMLRVNEVRSQREVIHAIEGSGGLFIYWGKNPAEWELIFFELEPPGPAWLRSVLGDFYFARSVELSYSMLWQPKPVDLSDFDLADKLAKLPPINRIDLSDTNVGADQVERLQQIFPNCAIER